MGLSNLQSPPHFSISVFHHSITENSTSLKLCIYGFIESTITSPLLHLCFSSLANLHCKDAASGENLLFVFSKTKGQISTFVFTTLKVQSLNFLNPKFQASSHRLWLYSQVCVLPSWKPRRQVFSQSSSYKLDYTKINLHLICCPHLSQKSVQKWQHLHVDCCSQKPRSQTHLTPSHCNRKIN